RGRQRQIGTRNGGGLVLSRNDSAEQQPSCHGNETLLAARSNDVSVLARSKHGFLLVQSFPLTAQPSAVFSELGYSTSSSLPRPPPLRQRTSPRSLHLFYVAGLRTLVN